MKDKFRTYVVSNRGKFEVHLDKDVMDTLIELVGKQKVIDFKLVDRLVAIEDGKMVKRKIANKSSEGGFKNMKVYAIEFSSIDIRKVLKMLNDCEMSYQNYDSKNADGGYTCMQRLYSCFRYGMNISCGVRQRWCNMGGIS